VRVLIVDPKQKRPGKEGEPDGPLSFFFSPELTETETYDLIVLPVLCFLSQPENLPNNIPIFAYGPVHFLADALAGGCSDYLIEPYLLEELEARALRFWRIHFRLGEAIYYYSRGCLEGNQTSVRLPEGQRKVLELLLHRLGQAVPRTAFTRSLGLSDSQRSRLLDMNLSRLRKIFSQVSGDAGAGAFLVAVRNYGYLMAGKPCV